MSADQPLHVCLISAPPVETHGWGRYTRELAFALHSQGIALTLITGIDAPETTDLPLMPGRFYRILPSVMQPKRFSRARMLGAARRVQALTAKADIVHVTAEPYSLSCLLVGRPLVVTAHGTYLPLTALDRLWGGLYRNIFSRSRVICVSSYTQKQVIAALPDAQTTVILNGVNLQSVREPAPPVAKTGPTVLNIGQLKPRKGFHILARAMKAVRAAIPDARAVFIGDDSDTAYVEAIRAQLAADGLTDTVRIAGRVSDSIKRGWLQAADVFALPALNTGGKFEGFGLVYLEASAAGLPVIGTRDCGAEDAIRDGETGLLIPQDDPTTLAEMIIRLLRDSALRQQMGAAGWAYAEQYTWDQVAARVIAVYRQCLDAKRPAPGVNRR